ncbi:MAG: sugar phosphate isomerase/epimerase family protein [Paracoccaceae bacterium]
MKKNKQRLQIYTSLWSMKPHDNTGNILSHEDICLKVKDAGFVGLALDLGASDVNEANAIRPYLEKNDLIPLIVAFPKTVSSFEDTLKMAKDFGSPFVDVIGQVTPLSVDGMIPIIRAWLEMSEKIGMPIQFETHRNCITNDLYSTLLLLDAVPEMRLCADLSHYVVDREFWFPLSTRDLNLMSRIIERSDSFQGRVASRQQIQLQLHFPQNQKWVELFKNWWKEGIQSWKRRNSEGDFLFLCELGPPEYAITNELGHEMSNRWEESLTIKSWIEELWINTY